MSRGSGSNKRRGPGGPTRPSSSGRVTSSSDDRPRRHRPDTSGLLDPTLSRLVGALLDTARAVGEPDHPLPGPTLEMWAARLATSTYAPGEMPSTFYGDLGRALAGSEDPLAPAALAALAVALPHRDAAPLRRTHREWVAARPGLTGDPSPADLGIGRPTAVRAKLIEHVDGAADLIFGFDQGGVIHSAGFTITAPDDDPPGRAEDLWFGPGSASELHDAGPADAPPEGRAIELTEAAEMARAAFAATDESPDLSTPEDQALRPLFTPRLKSLPEV